MRSNAGPSKYSDDKTPESVAVAFMAKEVIIVDNLEGRNR